MIVETVKINNATIRVHDDLYRKKTKEEVQNCIDRLSRMVTESLIRQGKVQTR